MRGLALVLLVGCQPLAAIPVGECGNGVVETGEDCDSFGHDGGECSAECRFVCATAADCPPGWGCGADEVCRHALGVLADPTRLGGVAAVSFSTGDLDGDGFDDLVVGEPGNLSVFFGGATGLTAGVELSTLGRNGPVMLADLDGDGALDLGAPSAGALPLWHGSADRSLKPVVFAPYELPSPSLIIPLEADRVAGAEMLLFENRGMSLFPPFPGQVVAGLPGGRTLADLVPGSVAIGAFHLGFTGGEGYVLAFPGELSVIVYRVNINDFAPETSGPQVSQTVALEPGWRVGPGGARIVDEREGNPPALYIHGINLDDGSHGILRARHRGLVDVEPFESTAALMPDYQMIPLNFATSCDPTTWPLAFADLDGAPPLDFIGRRGICLLRDGFIGLIVDPVLHAPIPWSEAEVGDFNRDGHDDLALVDPVQPQVMFVLSDGAGNLNPSLSPTESVPRQLVARDIDGDFHPELLAVEGGDDEPARLTALFGRSEGAPRDPGVIAEFDEITWYELSRQRDVDGQVDGLGDAYVTAVAGGQSRLAILAGSADRRPRSPYLLRVDGALYDPLAAMAGDFAGRGRELLVVTEPYRSFMLAPTAELGLSQIGTEGPFPDALDARCTVFAVGRVDDSGRDVVVAADQALGKEGCIRAADEIRPPRVAIGRFDAGDLDGPTWTAGGMPLQGGRIAQLALFDLDDDGRDDVIAVDTALRIAWSGPGGPDLTAPTTLPSVAAAVGCSKCAGTISGFATGDVDGDGATDLLVVSDSGLDLVPVTGRTLGTPRRLVDVGPDGWPARRVAIADVNGDGVPDVAVLVGLELVVFAGVAERP